MSAVMLRVRTELRRHRWSWAALAVVVGVVGGTVLALAAGARRTESAYSRFLTQYPASDYAISGSSDFGFGEQFDLTHLGRLPEVQTSSRVQALPPVALETDGGRELAPSSIVAFVSQDANMGRTVDAWKLVDGRLADPGQVDEIVVGFVVARDLSIGVGSTLRVEFISRDSLLRLAPATFGCLSERVSGQPSERCASRLLRLDPPDLAMTFRVVGVEASALAFPPYEGNLSAPIHLTSAFADRYAADLAGVDMLFVRLHDGADEGAFLDGVAATNRGTALGLVSVGADHAVTVQRSIHLQAIGLGLLAALVGVAVAYAVGQGFARQTFLAIEDDVGVLRSLGMTNRQLVGTGLLRSGGTALAGAALAVAFAIAVSPLLPVGLARVAEPDPGVEVDVVVLVLGALAILALALTVAMVTTLRAVARLARGGSMPTPSVAARLVKFLRLPAPAGIGIRHALEPGRGRTAVPVRGALIASILAVGAIVACATLVTSIDHLLSTPRLYGWSRDAQIGAQGNPPLGAAVIDGLEARNDVGAFAAGTIIDIEVGGLQVSTFALDDRRGAVALDLREGRRPQADDEIVLGTKTLDETGLAVGDRVPVLLANEQVDMTVVGSAVFSAIGSHGQLGRGAQITFSALQRVLPAAPTNIVHVDFVSDADAAALRTEFEEAVSPLPVFGPAPPTDLTNFGRVDNLPMFLAAGMLVLATMIHAYTLLTSVRRRRRDYATLSALGARPTQIAGMVTMQATTVAVVSVGVGVPLGLLVGNRMWQAIANEIGVPSEFVADAVGVALIAVAAVVVANAVAMFPAWIARRTRASLEFQAASKA